MIVFSDWPGERNHYEKARASNRRGQEGWVKLINCMCSQCVSFFLLFSNWRLLEQAVLVRHKDLVTRVMVTVIAPWLVTRETRACRNLGLRAQEGGGAGGGVEQGVQKVPPGGLGVEGLRGVVNHSWTQRELLLDHRKDLHQWEY